MTDVAELCTQTYKESRPVDVLPTQGLMYLASWSTIRPRQLQTVASTVCKVNRFSMLKDAIRNPPSTKCRASFYAMESRGSWECVSGWMCQCCDVSIPCLRLFSSRILQVAVPSPPGLACEKSVSGPYLHQDKCCPIFATSLGG